MSLNDFTDPLAWLAVASIAFGVWLLLRYGRDPKVTPVRFRPGLYVAATWQPAVPPVIKREPVKVPWTPPYAELTVAASLRRFGDNTDDIARRMLCEIAAEQRQAVTA